MRSLFDVMKAEKITSFTIDYNYKTDIFSFKAEKEWDENIDFSLFKKGKFDERRLLLQEPLTYGTEAVYEMCESRDALTYLDEILHLMRKGRHETIRLYYYEKYNIRFACFEHSTIRGMANRCHAITCGGIRRQPLSMKEEDVFVDGINLGRAMSFKNFAAEIPFGGCKIILHANELDLNNDEIIGFIAFAIERVRVVTAPDMNLPAEISDLMFAKGYSKQFVGGKQSKTGTTGKPTAYGVFLSLKEAVKFRENKDSLKGKSVLLIGLGAVGWNMGEYLLADGAELYVSDINDAKADQFIKDHSKHMVRKISMDSIFDTEVEILSPCAAGGLITEENIDELKCSYIWGSANNQLKAASIEDEIQLAKKIKNRGILYQSEWWHNTAGVICMAEEYLNDGTEESLMRRVEHTIPQATRKNLEDAEKQGITPTESCYLKCEAAIYKM